MDSGWHPEESWAAHAGHVFDIVIIDCTNGNAGTWGGHGSVGEAIEIKNRMLAEGTAHANTQFVVNHFSHNGGLLHHELEELLAGTGILVGYDGMIIEA
jgi:phosphoribosyl 1,2-cyclic phosphate phosphodiesterase